MKRIELTIGLGKDRAGKRIAKAKSNQAIKAVQNQAITLFGGETTTLGQGAWKSPSGAIVAESSAIVTIFANGGKATSKKAVQLAQFAKQALNQESVALAISAASVDFV